MALTPISVEILYKSDNKLRKEDVLNLLDWVNKQPHLPKITELEALFFLHCCYYKNEMAKTVVDNFYTLRTRCPEMFKTRNATLNTQIDLCLITTLPKPTPEGYTIFLIKFIDGNPENFSFQKTIRLFDMILLMHLYQNGISNGHVVILDFTDITFTHVLKAGPLNVKKLFFYLQEASPLRLKGLHFYHIVPFMDKVLSLIKPFMKKEVAEMLHLHDTVDSLTKFVPLECLPGEFGGAVDSAPVLHSAMKKKIEENNAFFEWEEKLVVDDKRREGKFQNDDIFGIDGTFKKLDID